MFSPELNRIPAALIGGVATLPDLVVSLASLRGTRREDADRVVNLFPTALRLAPCFLDRLTARWRYVFGDPLVGLPDGTVVLGTHMYHEVHRLFDVISCAEQRLAAEDLAKYLRAIDDPAKHENALVEFVPILRLQSSFEIHYEVPGAGDATVDWLIRSPGCPDLLLEVKNRVRDLFEGLRGLQSDEVDQTIRSEPQHDHNLLFRSVEKKFLPRKSTEAVQAVWIKTDIRQEETELQAAFQRLDSARVHVTIIGDWANDAYILANDDTAKQLVVHVLDLKESRRFVFRRGEPVG